MHYYSDIPKSQSVVFNYSPPTILYNFIQEFKKFGMQDELLLGFLNLTSYTKWCVIEGKSINYFVGKCPTKWKTK